MATQEMSSQDVSDLSPPDERESSAWGFLLPLSGSGPKIYLTEKVTTVGRSAIDSQATVQIDGSYTKYLSAMSKIHFEIKREDGTAGARTMISDLSTNGTFVNGERLTRDVPRHLSPRDEIAIAVASNKILMFVDNGSSEQHKYPMEIRERYLILWELGRGAMGEVRLASRKSDSKELAVKIVQKIKITSCGPSPSGSSDKAIEREVTILRELNHPCVVRMYDAVDNPTTCYIVMELVAGGELFDRIVKSEGSRLPEPIAKLYFYQMLLALEYLHGKGITHRDLKPENVLLATESLETLVKITDFGLSKFINNNSLMKTFCGTPNYLAPEILKGKGEGEYTNAVDVWSLAVILFVCLVGYPPFSKDYKNKPLEQQIVTGAAYFDEARWQSVSNDAKDMVVKCMKTDVAKRLTVKKALQHKWVKDEEMRQKTEQLMSLGPNEEKNGKECVEVGPSGLRKRGPVVEGPSGEDNMEADENGCGKDATNMDVDKEGESVDLAATNRPKRTRVD